MASTTEHSAAGGSIALPSVPAADWLIRASLAGTFLFHGIEKIPYLSAGAEMMGMPLWLWTLVALVEIAAGAAILVGGALRNQIGDLLTRASGVGIIAIMIGAIYLVHGGQWSSVPSETHPYGGMEFHTLMLATGLFFVLRGNRA